MSTSNATTDHETIRSWAEARGAVPSEVASTHKRSEPGILRFQFPGAPGEKDENLREISWDAFFEKFDENNLELVYQDKTADGERSNFNKLVHSEQSSSSGKSSASGKSSSSSKSHSSGKRQTAEVSDSPDEFDSDDDLDDEDEEDDEA